MTRPATQPGFTLLEVIMSLAISAMLFVGISSVLSASLSYSRDVTGVVRFRQEQQRIYLALRNAFAEAEKVMFSSAGKVILRNKSTSALRPFTIIENPGGTDNRLIIQDFTIDPASPATPTTAPRPTKDVTTAGKTMRLDPATNRVIIGTNPTAPCTSTFTSPCILFNYKNNTLDFGITGNAPFVGAPLITDIQADPSDPSNFIQILSPYEKREYRIRVTANQQPTVTFITLAGSGEFPYYYASGTATTPALGAATSMAGTPPATKPFQITSFVRATPAPGNPPLDVITLTLTDLTNTTRQATIVIPVLGL